MTHKAIRNSIGTFGHTVGEALTLCGLSLTGYEYGETRWIQVSCPKCLELKDNKN